MTSINNFYWSDNNNAIAYILGIYLTDGSVFSTDKSSKRFHVATLDREIPEKVSEASELLFGKRAKVYPVKEKYWGVYVNSQSMSNWLVNETNDKQCLPVQVFHQSKDWLRLFLSGLLDGDGWATFSQNRYATKDGKPPTWYAQIGLVGLTDSYLIDVPGVLNILNVRHKINKVAPRKEGYQEQTRILINPVSFVEAGLFFNVTRKQRKVDAFKHYSTVSND